MGRSTPPRGDKVGFAGEIGVAADEVGRAVEDALVRAAVVRERQPPARKPGAYVFDLRVAPAVDRLLRVANHRDVAKALRGGQADEVELDAVGVLELIDDQIAEALAAAPSKLRHSLERIDDLEEQVVEIAQPPFVKRVLVGAIDRVQDLDGLQLRAGGVWAARSVCRGPRAPVLSMQVERPVTEAFGIDAATLQLEQEAKSGSQEVVQVVDRQRAERVGIEGR